MSLLANVFKRKPGGTLLGNALRKVVKTAAGYIPGVGPIVSQFVGNGTMMISQEEYDLKNLSDADYQAKYAKSKTGVVVPNAIPQPQVMTLEQTIDQIRAQNAKPSFMDSVKKAVTLPVVAIVGGMLAVMFIIIKTIKKK